MTAAPTDGRDLPAALPHGEGLRLIILDCDGVLFDSRNANVAFYDTVLASAGVPPLDDEGRRLCHTLSSPQLYARLFASDPVLHQRVVEVSRTIDYGPFYDLMVPARAIEDTLRRLRSHCPLALATNRGTTAAQIIERFRLREFFDIRVGILDVPRPKPAPDLLLACLERAGVAPDAAIYAGDTELDRTAAQAAGVPFVGVGQEIGARWVIGEIAALPGLLFA